MSSNYEYVVMYVLSRNGRMWLHTAMQNNGLCWWNLGARGNLVVKALAYKPESRVFETRWGEILNLPNPSGRTRPWNLLSLLTEMNTGNIKEIMFGGSKVGLTTLSPFLRRLSRQCAILNISQPYRPPRPVNGDSFTLLYVLLSPDFFAIYLLDGPMVYSASNRNEHQKVFLGVKRGQRVKSTT
jgi:hypothetical protein